ncbi:MULTISPECIES: hypothetical protein [Bacillales]|uniref:McrB family protein n=1 Tax=Bacillales TaxID=1385 RepID=UPI000345E78B|nr:MULTISPECIES: hypothetical protein [Bacillales]KMZ43539.1 hypothetical protein AC624_22065 [Bacillus sp. FJAT-27238]
MLEDLKVSLTKFGVIEVINIIKNGQLEEYLDGTYEASHKIDRPQINAALGITENDPSTVPVYWKEIDNFPELIELFCLVAVIFSHHDLIKKFKESRSEAMRGVLHKDSFSDVKVFTNVRRLLLHSGAAPVTAERSDNVPYDFSPLFANSNVGRLIKQLLLDRLKRINWNDTPSLDQREFYRSFIEQCVFYGFHEVFSVTQDQLVRWFDGEAILNTNRVDNWLGNEWQGKIVQVDTHLLLSLATKPFLILTGSSGTGKTYGVRRLASLLNPTDDPDFNLTFIAVEAGWKDGRHLIGYKNPFGEKGEVYQPTPLIKMLLKASSEIHQNIPFFVLFDEMNLSHVEMYFAKFLALLETARHKGLHNQPLLSKNDLELMLKYFENSSEYTSYILEAIEYGGLYIPQNVFFIGTVNIDETTYMFSPKVLDRSFVIEMNTLPPSSLRDSTADTKTTAELSIIQVSAFLLEGGFKGFRDSLGDGDGFEALNINGQTEVVPSNVLNFMEEVYKVMSLYPFGYRIVTECIDYFIKALHLQQILRGSLNWITNENSLYDEMLMQKILPKLHGNRKQLSKTLSELQVFCKKGNEVRFPKTLEKVKAMENQLVTIGYSGFIC